MESVMVRGGVLRIIGLAAVLALVASGCGSKADSSVAAPAATSTTAADAFAVPADPNQIDAAYISRVMVELEKVRGDVRRDVLSTHSISQADYDRIEDIYDGDEQKAQKQIFSDLSMTDSTEAKQNPGDEVLTVTSIRSKQSNCIAFEATHDVNTVLRNPESPVAEIVVLWTAPVTHSFNSTPWKIEGEQPLSVEKIPYQC